VLDERVGHKEGKLSRLYQIGQQKGVFSPERDWVKQTPLNVHSRTPDGESSGIQVANTTVWLEHVILNRHEPQFFCSTHQPCAVSD